MTAAARDGLQDDGERIHAFTHLSMSIATVPAFTTYVFRRGASPDETLARWHKLKRATSDVVVAHGARLAINTVSASITRRIYRPKRRSRYCHAQNSFNYFDPDNMLNPGKLTL